MRTAIYARKSTSQDVADEAKSVSRQVEGARAFAEKRGWAVVGEHIYLDDGVSGAEWLDRDLNRLITAARAKPKPFDVLVTLDIDRVGRDGVHTVPKLAEVLDQGVRVFFYQTGEEVSVKTPKDVFMLQARAFAAADYRHQVRTKTRDALRAKAERVRRGWQGARIPERDRRGRREEVPRHPGSRPGPGRDRAPHLRDDRRGEGVAQDRQGAELRGHPEPDRPGPHRPRREAEAEGEVGNDGHSGRPAA